MNSVTRGIRNAFRNVIRTVSIAGILGLVTGLSLAMLVAYQAVGAKISNVKRSVGNTVSISPAGARGYEGGGTALTADQLAKVAKLAHVTSLDESLGDRLTSDSTSLKSAVEAGNLGRRNANNNGTGFSGGDAAVPPDGAGGFRRGQSGASGIQRTFTPPVTVNGTTNPTDLSGSGVGGGSFTLKSGNVFNTGGSDNVALLGSTLASKNNLQVGSTFTAYNTSIKVVGIFDAGNSFANNQVIMPLASVQKLSGQNGAVTGATAHVDSIDQVSGVTAAVRSALGSAADVTNASERAGQVVAPLQSIQRISLYSLIGAAAAGAVIILLSMVMIVRERRREIGVLKAIGASNVRVVSQFMAEAVTLTTLGAVIGIVLGAVAANPITRLLVSNSSQTGPGEGMRRGFGAARMGLANLSNVSATVGWDIILYGIGVAILIAVVGSAVAALFIAKVRPMEVMRTE